LLKIQSSNRFFIDTLKLGAGTTIGQILIAFSAPILSRLYLPEAFGAFAVFNSLVITLSMISGLRYELAILLPHDDRDGFHLLNLQMLLNLSFALVFGVLIGVFRHPLASALGRPDLANLLWWSGFAILLFGVFNGMNYWNTRFRRYKMVGFARIVDSAVMTLTQIALAVRLNLGAGGLIAGLLIGKAAENSVHLVTICKEDRHFWRLENRWQHSKALMHKYRKFPQFNMWATLLNTLSWQAPALLLTAMFDLKVAGFYAIGERVIRLPMNVIGRAIAQVFFQQGAEAHRTGKLRDIFCQTVRMLSVLGLIPTLILSLAGRDLFTVLLGAQWAEAGVYVQILSIWAFIWFLSSPLSTIITITEKQEKSLLFNILILSTRLISLAVGGLLHSARLAMLIFALTGIFSYGWLLLYTGTESGVRPRTTLKLLLATDWRWIVFTVLSLSALRLFSLSPIWMCFAAIAILGAYSLTIAKQLTATVRISRS